MPGTRRKTRHSRSVSSWTPGTSVGFRSFERYDVHLECSVECPPEHPGQVSSAVAFERELARRGADEVVAQSLETACDVAIVLIQDGGCGIVVLEEDPHGVCDATTSLQEPKPRTAGGRPQSGDLLEALQGHDERILPLVAGRVA